MADFASKQTNNSLPPHRYTSKVLIGNWYEERCDPENKSAFVADIEKFDNLKLYEKYNEANKANIVFSFIFDYIIGIAKSRIIIRSSYLSLSQ